MTTESELQAQFLVDYSKYLPDVRLFRRHIMVAQVGQRTMRAGIPGQCDLYGFVRGSTHIEIELKAAGGSLRPEQCAWRDFCEEMDVFWLLLKAEKGDTRDRSVAKWILELAVRLQKKVHHVELVLDHGEELFRLAGRDADTHTMKHVRELEGYDFFH